MTAPSSTESGNRAAVEDRAAAGPKQLDLSLRWTTGAHG
jgi:hypothetical protein